MSCTVSIPAPYARPSYPMVPDHISTLGSSD